MKKIKNMKINDKLFVITLASGLTLTTLSGCGNEVYFDTQKSFNVVVELNEGNAGIIGIREYDDYTGSQIQFTTIDGLCVLSSTHQTQLLNVKSEEIAEKYALGLVSNDESRVIDYNEMQGVSIDVSGDKWNKTLLDTQYLFNKAIILSEDNAMIVNVNSWTDYEDDKIQIELNDGTYVLTSIDEVKLIDDMYAKKDSLKNYAISLVGSEDKVIYYDEVLVKTNTRQ